MTINLRIGAMMLQAQPLTQVQIDQYNRDGYLVVPDLLMDAEASRFLEHVPTNRDFPGGGLLGHVTNEQYRALALQPRTVACARQILGGAIKIVQTMYLDKAAKGGKGIALHQDSHYLPNEPNTLMACWVALTDTDADNGGLCVVPGSHKGGLRSAHLNEHPDDHDTWEAEYDMIDPDGREYKKKMYAFEIDDVDPRTLVRLAVPRGAGVFFTGMTIHGSFANHSPNRPRYAFATHYVHANTWLYRRDVHDAMPVE